MSVSFKKGGQLKKTLVFFVQERGESLSRELIPLSHQAPGTSWWCSEEALHLWLLLCAEDQAATALTFPVWLQLPPPNRRRGDSSCGYVLGLPPAARTGPLSLLGRVGWLTLCHTVDGLPNASPHTRLTGSRSCTRERRE